MKKLINLAENYTKDYINCVEQYVKNNTQLLKIREKYEIALKHIEENTLEANNCIAANERVFRIYDVVKCKYYVSTEFDCQLIFTHLRFFN